MIAIWFINLFFFLVSIFIAGQDDLLAEGVTDINGNFQLQGGTNGVFKMNVFLKIYHDCEDSIKVRNEKVKLRLICNSSLVNEKSPSKSPIVSSLDHLLLHW